MSYNFKYQLLFIDNLHKSLEADLEYKTYIGKTLMYKVFLPTSREDIPEYFYPLIAVVLEYFDCRAYWVNYFEKNNIDPIKTIRVIGYMHNIILCYRYLAHTLNMLLDYEFYKREINQVVRRRKRRKYKYHHNKPRPIRSKDSRLAARESTELFVNRLTRVWQRRLERKEITSEYFIKMDNIYTQLRKDNEIDFGKYRVKSLPNIARAFCRKGRYQKHKLLMF